MELPASEVLELELARRPIRLLRPVDLVPYVDTQALLSAHDPPEPPYWMHLWPAALVLARRLAEEEQTLAGKCVVELGCGLALPGILACRRGARVVVTDWKGEPLRLACASATLNGVAVDAVQMDWSNPALSRVFDLCLCADVAYDAQGEGALVSAIAALLVRGGRALIADSVNIHRNSLLPALRAHGFDVQVTTAQEREGGRRLWVRLVEAVRE